MSENVRPATIPELLVEVFPTRDFRLGKVWKAYLTINLNRLEGWGRSEEEAVENVRKAALTQLHETRSRLYLVSLPEILAVDVLES